MQALERAPICRSHVKSKNFTPAIFIILLFIANVAQETQSRQISKHVNDKPWLKKGQKYLWKKKAGRSKGYEEEEESEPLLDDASMDSDNEENREDSFNRGMQDESIDDADDDLELEDTQEDEEEGEEDEEEGEDTVRGMFQEDDPSEEGELSEEEEPDEKELEDEAEYSEEAADIDDDEGYSSNKSRKLHRPESLPPASAPSHGVHSRSTMTDYLRDMLLKPTDPTKPGLKKTLAEYTSSGAKLMSDVVSTGRRMQRDVKEYFAGDFESNLLKVTRPDDYAPDPLSVDWLLGQTRFFVQDDDVTSNSNAYRHMLKKIWNKLTENDWRTVTKALFLLHKLFREIGAEDSRCFKVLLEKISREVYDKRTMQRCFSLTVIGQVNSGESQIYEDFIKRYAYYVLKRARTFTSGFVELKLVGGNMRPEDVIATLSKAKKAIAAGLDCALTADEESEVTVCCLDVVVRDLYDLWVLFHKKLLWVVSQQNNELFQAWDPYEVSLLLDQFKDFYNAKHNSMQAFLVESDELLSLYGLSLPPLELPPKHRFEAPSIETKSVLPPKTAASSTDTATGISLETRIKKSSKTQKKSAEEKPKKDVESPEEAPKTLPSSEIENIEHTQPAPDQLFPSTSIANQDAAVEVDLDAPTSSIDQPTAAQHEKGAEIALNETLDDSPEESAVR